MSLSTIDLVPTTPRPVRAHTPRRRLRNARRALVLVTAGTAPSTVPTSRDRGVRLHPAELGPWDD